jgi:hypothetical protein
MAGGMGGFTVGLPAFAQRPQSLQGNCLSILGLLDSPVNVVLNSNPGPGLEKLFVGLGPSGAWLAPCAQDVVYLGGRDVPRRCCSYWRTVVGGPSPVSRGRIFGGLRLFDFDAVLRKSGVASNGLEHTSEETNERRSGSHRR